MYKNIPNDQDYFDAVTDILVSVTGHACFSHEHNSGLLYEEHSAAKLVKSLS